jgi:hypothetical protein
VIVNRGGTRGDDLATYKVEAGCSEFLSDLADVSSVEPGEPVSRPHDQLTGSRRRLA